jgi:signal transduction histidine kinase
VQLELDENLPPIMADENRLEQVFVNLVNNARYAMLDLKRGGHAGPNVLTVKSFSEHGRVTATVSDTGPGIPPELTNKIFDPFFTTKGEKGGTGLGLSIVHKIIKDHGGNIIAASESGKGTTFTITLPR